MPKQRPQRISIIVSNQFDKDLVLTPWMDSILNAPQILVGLSGGMDSMLLLKLLAERIDPELICAVHINHGLSPNADLWQATASEFCAALGVDFYSRSVQVKSTGLGIEAAARQQRYKVFEDLLKPGGLLFLAHHADDQAETLLYRLFRGSGPKGLAAMANYRSIGSGVLIRPLLTFNKSQLNDCATELGLHWIEDESNQDNSFDRNYLRNKVLPEVGHRWPDYSQSLQRTAQLCAESEQLVEDLAKEDLLHLDVRQERAGWSINISSLSLLSPPRQRNILRHWPGLNEMPMPGSKIINQIMDTVIAARDDATPKVVWQSMQWARFQGRLYLLLLQAESCPQQQSTEWDLRSTLKLADNSILLCEEVIGHGLRLDVGPVEVRCRQGGERCRPEGRAHSSSLKKLLQEYALPPWWRDRIPLLYVQDQLVAVGDLWVCEGWAVASGEKGVEIKWLVDCLS